MEVVDRRYIISAYEYLCMASACLIYEWSADLAVTISLCIWGVTRIEAR